MFENPPPPVPPSPELPQPNEPPPVPPPPSLKKTTSINRLFDLTRHFFPFLTDEMQIKEYFNLKPNYFYDDLEQMHSDEYILHHIPDMDEMYYFLYDVEYCYRKALGNHTVFRSLLIKRKLYKLFNILLGESKSTYQSLEDNWESLGYQLLVGWYVINESFFNEDELIDTIKHIKKYEKLMNNN